MNQQIWLSRDGKTEGPFDQAHVDQLKASGEIKKYAWIWTPDAKAWSPIHMAPPPPPVAQKTQTPATASAPATTASSAAAHASSATAKPSTTSTPASAGPPAMKAGPATRSAVKPLAAICHDNRSVVAGMLDAKLGEVWILSTKQKLTELPPFRKGAKVWINLLDEQSGQSENAQATLMDYKKTSDAWEYSLKWQSQAPNIVS